MFEGIAFIIISIIGGLAALLAVFFFVLAAIGRSRAMLNFGLAVMIVPVTAALFSYWFYEIHIPGMAKREEKRYTGIYTMIFPQRNDVGPEQPPTQLVLNRDNSFQLDKNDFTPFHGTGSWRAGATDDGQFEFKDKWGRILFWAIPSRQRQLEIHTGDGRRLYVFAK